MAREPAAFLLLLPVTLINPQPGRSVMTISKLSESQADFHIQKTSPRLQTATMLLRTGEATGPVPEAHDESDQTLLVLEGTLEAEIGDDLLTLHAGDSIIVPAGMKHRFHNTDREAALAFTVYGPPAYPAEQPV